MNLKMITKTSSDKEILDFVVAGMTIRELGAMTFMAWILNKVSGAPTYRAATQELIGLASNPPIGKIPDEEKVRIVRKLLSLDITL